MKDIVQKFTKPDKLAMDAFSRPFSAAKACVLLKHRIFIGGEFDPSRVTEAMTQVTLLFARQVLNTKRNIDEEGTFRRSTRFYINIVEAIEVRKHLDTWKFLTELPPMQTTSPQML